MASLLVLGQKGALGHLIERNLLSGIADASGRCLGLGIIEHIDFARAHDPAHHAGRARQGSDRAVWRPLRHYERAANSDRSNGRGSRRYIQTRLPGTPSGARGCKRHCHAAAAALHCDWHTPEPEAPGEPLKTPAQWAWHVSQLPSALRCQAVIS